MKSAFPTPAQGLALKASLLDGDRALEAWRKLSKEKGPDDAGIAWVAPLLMANIRRLAPDDPWVKANPHFLTVADLKGRAVVKSAEEILGVLDAASVKTLALKGLALMASVYDSPGLRTVTDLDILVPGKDLFRAMDALRGHGLKSGPDEPECAADLRGNHAHVFSPPKRHQLSVDLHWHVLASARGDDDDACFWEEARPIKVGSVSTLALCPEDQLFHVLLHGVRWTRMPHVRWVADAVLLLRRAKKGFRTERFLETMARFDAVVPVQEGLGYVHELCGEGGDLLERTKTLKRSRFAEQAFKARSTSYEDRTVADRIAMRIETAVWKRRARKRSKA
jgi:hypothetical protein